MPYTKIVATLGPASDSPEAMRALIKNGMNVARINFAHGTHEEHAKKIADLRAISSELGIPVAILQDLGGPKIRVGDLPSEGVSLKAGDLFCLYSEEGKGDKRGVSVTYPELPDEVETGDPILLADGLLELEVVDARPTCVECRVVTGGVLTSHKGINLPTRTLKTSALTEKDIKDLDFGMDEGVDYVGVSFVRSAADIRMVKDRMIGRQAPVIAKIEKHEAIANIDEILEEADGIMVARGDLGVEVPLEEVPTYQKILIRKANALGKPVITATQMLRSMVDSPRPTRAEATDVANAVLDGTDAVMLSEETAMGAYPIEAVQYMARIAKKAEETFSYEHRLKQHPEKDMADSVAHASCVLAEHLGASAILAATASGLTAKKISHFRPQRKIVALSPNESTVRELSLYWGCTPVLVSSPKDTDALINSSARAALDHGLISKGDLVVITAGHPIGGAGTTNMLRVMQL
ncbi:pyruvate kinase [Desulfatibacillum alkenivorans DSM 16219]|jgi:pyruvate kinase|uniref:Pyruvate kinase n=1 Tax=Desulfatibacillum alkenivorans DSM 16219 TaxID=1121393 RepID=A0A1M6FN77_9BACT|nr:pyruvate kinase [Desulfatibacillum alkenivorans]SHI99208.1 pyruvate kinase [Desulfatibacillum alkenivorans DSM 16219]